MVEKRYTQVSLPTTLAVEIDREIASSGLGYMSRAEFVKEAIRERLDRMRKKGIAPSAPTGGA